jgi:hypothetical protein
MGQEAPDHASCSRDASQTVGFRPCMGTGHSHLSSMTQPVRGSPGHRSEHTLLARLVRSAEKQRR